MSLLAPSAVLATNQVWSQDGLPGPRFGHAIAFDPDRQQIVLFGGGLSSTSFGALANDVECHVPGDSVWTKLDASGTPPSKRQGHAMVYDPVHQRMLVFGGADASSVRQDLWSLDMGHPAHAWSLLPASSPQPPARYQHAMAWDPDGQRLILFGGSGTSGSLLNDVWAFSVATDTWQLLAPTGIKPAARRGSTMTWDPVRHRMIVFGGQTPGAMNDVWALTLGASPAWTALSPGGVPPTSRAYHMAVFAPSLDGLLVFGGLAGGVANDLWTLSLSAPEQWSPVSAGVSLPPARISAAACYDPVRDQMIVSGGASSGVFGDLWALDANGTPQWHRLRPSGEQFAPRSDHSLVLDTARDRAILFGGYNGSQDLSDTWAIPLGNTGDASKLVPLGTAPIRSGHDAFYDAAGDRMIVVGGRSGSIEPTVSVFALQLSGTPTWTTLHPGGGLQPNGRAGHTMVPDPTRNRILMVGGLGPTVSATEVWALSGSGDMTWTPVGTAGSPPQFYSHVAVLDPFRGRLVVHVADQVWTLSLSGVPTWVQHFPANMPPNRNAHAGVYDPVRDRLVIFSGRATGTANPLQDAWELPLATMSSWTQLSSGTPSPAGRLDACALYDPIRDRMFLTGGGVPFVGPMNDVAWSMDWSAPLDVQDGPRPVLGSLMARPNPSPGHVTFAFQLDAAREASLEIHDVQGRLFERRSLGVLAAGPHSIEWDGRSSTRPAPPGLYFATLRTGDTTLRSRVAIIAP